MQCLKMQIEMISCHHQHHYPQTCSKFFTVNSFIKIISDKKSFKSLMPTTATSSTENSSNRMKSFVSTKLRHDAYYIIYSMYIGLAIKPVLVLVLVYRNILSLLLVHKSASMEHANVCKCASSSKVAYLFHFSPLLTSIVYLKFLHVRSVHVYDAHTYIYMHIFHFFFLLFFWLIRLACFENLLVYIPYIKTAV